MNAAALGSPGRHALAESTFARFATDFVVVKMAIAGLLYREYFVIKNMSVMVAHINSHKHFALSCRAGKIIHRDHTAAATRQ